MVGLRADFAHRIGAQRFQQNRRAVGQSVVHRHHRRKQLIVNFDQRRGLLRDVRVDGRHRRHRVPVIERLLVGQDVVAQIFEVDGALAQVLDLVLSFRQIRGRDDRTHAGQSLSLARVD